MKIYIHKNSYLLQKHQYCTTWCLVEILNYCLSPSSLALLWNNDMFLINKKPIILSAWIGRGVTSLELLLVDGLLMTFDHIQKEYNTPDCCHFQYIRLREIIKRKVHIIIPSLDQKLLAHVYKLLACNNSTLSTPTDK